MILRLFAFIFSFVLTAGVAGCAATPEREEMSIDDPKTWSTVEFVTHAGCQPYYHSLASTAVDKWNTRRTIDILLKTLEAGSHLYSSDEVIHTDLSWAYTRLGQMNKGTEKFEELKAKALYHASLSKDCGDAPRWGELVKVVALVDANYARKLTSSERKHASSPKCRLFIPEKVRPTQESLHDSL